MLHPSLNFLHSVLKSLRGRSTIVSLGVVHRFEWSALARHQAPSGIPTRQSSEHTYTQLIEFTSMSLRLYQKHKKSPLPNGSSDLQPKDSKHEHTYENCCTRRVWKIFRYNERSILENCIVHQSSDVDEKDRTHLHNA